MQKTLFLLDRGRVHDQSFSELSTEQRYIELQYQFCMKLESQSRVELLPNRSFNSWFG